MKTQNSPEFPEKASVGIVGARGYSGLELARILLSHPQAKLHACFFNDKAFRLEDLLPEAEGRGIPVLPLQELSGVDTVFLATPAEASIELASRLLAQGVSVIDLSGAFRLKSNAYSTWYGFEHSAPELLSQAVYGLVPWSKPEGSLIANPGCYATSVLMAILPVLRAGLIDPSTLVIDAKSGATGAGRKAAESLLFSEVDGECRPYRVGKHQHLPEITRFAEAFGGTAIEPFFSTHLLPTKRGIISSIYAKLNKGAGLAQVTKAFQDAYADYPLARFAPINEGGEALLSLNRVVRSACTQIAYEVCGEKLYLFSLIDNLMKGAASQAVENYNALKGLPVATGLRQEYV